MEARDNPSLANPFLLENCTFYCVKPNVFMDTIDFAKAVPFFWQKPQIVLGRSKKNKQTQIS